MLGRLLVPLLVAVTLAPAAFGSAPRSACGLLTNAEVGRVLGVQIAYRTPQPQACSWTTRPHTSFGTSASNLYVDLRPTSRARFAALEKQSSGRVRIVTGLGSAAYFNQVGPITQLWVWQHGEALSIISTEVRAPISVDKAAARIALGRL